MLLPIYTWYIPYRVSRVKLKNYRWLLETEKIAKFFSKLSYKEAPILLC